MRILIQKAIEYEFGSELFLKDKVERYIFWLQCTGSYQVPVPTARVPVMLLNIIFEET